MDLAILIASSLVIVAILSTRATQRFGLPALVLFVMIGMLAGSSGPGGIVFNDYALSLNVGLVALAVILFAVVWTRVCAFSTPRSCLWSASRPWEWSSPCWSSGGRRGCSRPSTSRRAYF
jgi:NhaP-type Na+/H+ and K+/H+ antiporter